MGLVSVFEGAGDSADRQALIYARELGDLFQSEHARERELETVRQALEALRAERERLATLVSQVQSQRSSLCRVADWLSSSAYLDECIIGDITGEMARYLGVSRCCISSLREDGALGVPVCSDGTGQCQRTPDGCEQLVGQLLAEGKEDGGWIPFGADLAPLAVRSESAGGYTVTAIPLLVGPRLLGVLGICTNRPLALADLYPLEVSVLAALSHQVAAALERVRLEEALRQKEDHVNLLLKATIEAQEQERERICLEVHDGVAQTLVPAFQYLQVISSTPDDQLTRAKPLLDKAAALVKQALREVREVISSLRPAMLDELGLVPTIRGELHEMQRQTGCQVELEADPVRLPRSVETALYRIVHEALSNARRHAQTQRLRVEVCHTVDGLVVQVIDWGIGFSMGMAVHPNKDGRGVGLLSMRKRTELLGGRCQIVSAPGEGTTVRVEVPVDSRR